MPEAKPEDEGETTNSGSGGSFTLTWPKVKNVLPKGTLLGNVARADKPVKVLLTSIIGFVTGVNIPEGGPQTAFQYVAALLKDPAGFVAGIARTVIFNSIVLPIITTLLNIYATLVNSTQFVLFGPDKLYPWQDGALPGSGGSVGLVDIPLYVSRQITAGLGTAGETILMPVNGVNSAIADIAASAGLGALPITAVLIVLEGGIALYVTRLGILAIAPGGLSTVMKSLGARAAGVLGR